MTTSLCTKPLYVYADFEFNRVSERNPQLVSCSLKIDDGEVNSFWLHKDLENQEKLKKIILALKGLGAIFVCWAAEAEARSLMSLGIDDCHFWEESWMDLFLEYRMLQNHSFSLMHGEQMVQSKDTKEWSLKKLRPFVDAKGGASLVAATYKLLGVRLDGKHKDEMRNLIISDPEEFTPEQKEAILAYNAGDIKYLSQIKDKINQLYRKRMNSKELQTLKKEALLRGNYAARTAKQVQEGYPINYTATRNFSDNVPVIMEEVARDLVVQFPQIAPFYWNKKDNRFSKDTKAIKQWIIDQGLEPGWMRTETGGISLSLDAFMDRFDFRHEFPEGNFGAQMVRYLKMQQSMNGFVNKAGKDEKSFWDYVGTDGRVRPYFNIFGAQSSRSQPSATGYIHLKSAWVRSLVQPSPGFACCGTDYSSQEFLIGALLSGDSRMFEAYRSGDPYIYYGKAFGVIPKDGTKETHGKERDACKATVLAMLFMMSEFGLAIKLTTDTGVYHDETKAKEYIDGFNEIFDVFFEWRESQIALYGQQGYLRLVDGWTMWGDNHNFRSVANMGVQGHGAVVMRSAVRLCQNNHIKIPITLHDALYGESRTEEMLNRVLDKKYELMKDAFVSSFPDILKEKASIIRMDQEVWSPDFPNQKGVFVTPEGRKVAQSQIYVDKRSAKDYEKYKVYFDRGLNLNVL